MKNFAYVTLATKKQFLICALRNGQRLKYVNSKYPLLILTTTNLYEDQKKLIVDNSCEQVKIIIIKNLSTDDSNFRYGDTINKLQILDLIQYDKLLFIDSDFLLLKNIDWFIENNTIENDQVFLFPKTLDQNNYGFGAFFLVKPNRIFYLDFINNIKAGHYIFIDDEDFFNKYYAQCHSKIETDFNSLGIFHFCGSIKPWELNFKTNFLYNLFFNTNYEIYNQILNLIINDEQTFNILNSLRENFVKFNIAEDKLFITTFNN